MDIDNNFKEQNFIPVEINGITIALPYVMNESEYSWLKQALNNCNKSSDDNRVYVYSEGTKLHQEHDMVNYIVNGLKEPSRILSNLSVNDYKDKNVEKIILQALSRCYASFSSAQLLFNFKYYIEYVSVLRMVYEQCAYVITICDDPSKAKTQAQKCVGVFNKIDKNDSKGYKRFYSVLSECAHLNIFKDDKVDESKVSDLFNSDEKMVVLRSTQKTINNFSIFKKVFNIYVDTCDYVKKIFIVKEDNSVQAVLDDYFRKCKSIENELFKNYSDALNQLKNVNAIINQYYEKGTVDAKSYLEE